MYILLRKPKYYTYILYEKHKGLEFTTRIPFYLNIKCFYIRSGRRCNML